MLQESLKTPTIICKCYFKVDLNQLDNHLILKISDDGVGFNVNQKKNWTTKHYLQNK
jgi:signal transduction histidine kinase